MKNADIKHRYIIDFYDTKNEKIVYRTNPIIKGSFETYTQAIEAITINQNKWLTKHYLVPVIVELMSIGDKRVVNYSVLTRPSDVCRLRRDRGSAKLRRSKILLHQYFAYTINNITYNHTWWQKQKLQKLQIKKHTQKKNTIKEKEQGEHFSN